MISENVISVRDSFSSTACYVNLLHGENYEMNNKKFQRNIHFYFDHTTAVSLNIVKIGPATLIKQLLVVLMYILRSPLCLVLEKDILKHFIIIYIKQVQYILIYLTSINRETQRLHSQSREFGILLKPCIHKSIKLPKQLAN